MPHSCHMVQYFNPRSHERSDHIDGDIAFTFLFQSTLPREERHESSSKKTRRILFQSTLPREERHCIRIEPPCGSRFQSTLPREERRLAGTYKVTASGLFQSTLPREERPCTEYETCNVKTDFNPRSHERSDGGKQMISNCGHDISIHAPTRGATSGALSSAVFTRFQSTLPREERLSHHNGSAIFTYFNPRSHERSDVCNRPNKQTVN